jgi:hypothetical protein
MDMALEPKYIRSFPSIIVADRHLKRYHVSNDDTPIDTRIEAAAYAMIPHLLPDWDGETPRGSWPDRFLAEEIGATEIAVSVRPAVLVVGQIV